MVLTKSALAAPYGTTAEVSFYDPSSTTTFDYDYGEQAFSAIALDTANFSAAAEAQLGQSNLSPILKARAQLFDQSVDSYSAAYAISLEQYNYTGTSDSTITYDFTVTGDVYSPAGAAFDSLIIGNVEFFVAPTLESYIDDIDALFPYITETLGSDYVQLSGNVTGGLANGSVSFSVHPGDTFFMLADLGAIAQSFSANANAFSTFAGSFVDASQLQALSLSVPEPSTLCLVLLASFSIAGSYRGHRKRKQ